MRLPTISALASLSINLAFGFPICRAATTSERPSVKLHNVSVIGRTVDNVNVYFAVPFAAPPTGSNRFKAPLPPTYTTDIDNDHQRTACMQGGNPSYGVSEDCLYADIWVPRNLDSNAKVPVMVYSYGGSFFLGTSAGSNYASFISRSVEMNQPVIVVAINYRLNSFGFGYGPTHKRHQAANTGLLDIKAAIQWVYDNIEVFGGDKNRITAFGLSAGAIGSAMMQIISDPPPIAGIISNSGAVSANPLTKTEDGFPDVFPLLVKGTKCVKEDHGDWSEKANDTAFECLRNVDAKVLLDATLKIRGMKEYRNGFPWNPSVDGEVITDSPNRLLKEGKFKKVAVMSGNTLDEGGLFSDKATDSTKSVTDQINWFEPSHLPDETMNQVLQLYPDDPALGSPYGTGSNLFGLHKEYKQLSSIIGDIGFHSSRRWTMSQNVDNGNPNVWTWQFSRHNPKYGERGTDHASDTAFWLNKVTAADKGTGGRELSEIMASYWVNFANFQDPNGKSGSGSVRNYWPKYGEGDGKRLLNIDGNKETWKLDVIADDFRADGMGYVNDHPDEFNS